MAATPRAFDLLALGAGATFLASLWFPWQLQRSCPLFEGCGPWAPLTGLEALGDFAWILPLAAAVALVVAWRSPVLRRLLPALVGLGAAAAVGVYGAWAGFAVFEDVRFPRPAFLVACASVTLASLSAFAGAAFAGQVGARAGAAADDKKAGT